MLVYDGTTPFCVCDRHSDLIPYQCPAVGYSSLDCCDAVAKAVCGYCYVCIVHCCWSTASHFPAPSSSSLGTIITLSSRTSLHHHHTRPINHSKLTDPTFFLLHHCKLSTFTCCNRLAALNIYSDILASRCHFTVLSTIRLTRGSRFYHHSSRFVRHEASGRLRSSADYCRSQSSDSPASSYRCCRPFHDYTSCNSITNFCPRAS